MGSQSDWETMVNAADTLKKLGVAYEAEVVSAHRTPLKLKDYALAARRRGLKVIIAGAGGAAHLPGMVAAMTSLPVMGVPVQSKSLDGIDSLLSIVQMPAGIPVHTFAIGRAGAINAALWAAAIVALGHPEIKAARNDFRAAQTKKVAEAKLPERIGARGRAVGRARDKRRARSGAGEGRSAGGVLPKGGEVGGGVEVVGERRQIDRGDAGRVAVEKGARAFLAGEVGQGFEMCAEKQSGRTVAAAVVGGSDAATGAALGRDEARDGVGGKRRLVAERDEGAVESARKLAERGDAGADRRGHAFGPGGAVGDEHGQAGEDGADFFGVRAEHDDDGPGGGGEGGGDGADDERLAVEFEELFGRAHARRSTRGEDDGAEAERRSGGSGLSHGSGGCVRARGGRRGRKGWLASRPKWRGRLVRVSRRRGRGRRARGDGRAVRA